ncbi:MAG TPA: outer membrane beta-barrel protein [Candidatus Polarisedimenticolia bacterium]|nr:outer membrane beta-barrel protein [Candidatus Polarisedimenticolia bacterium]
MRKAVLYLVLVPMLAYATAAQAKNRDKAWEFGAYAAHVDADRDAGVDNAVGPELRFGYNVTAKVGAELLYGRTSTEVLGIDTEFQRVAVVVTGNFLTDREISTIPYITAGLGIITGEVDTEPEAFDAGTILMLGVGARTFWHDDWGVRYEVRYNHQDWFEENQDEYVLALGITYLLGGEK